jgi:CubicO group peptidase (beta-lactamase class C family)
MRRSSVVLLVMLSACAGAPVKPQRLTPGDYSYAVKYGTWLIDRQMRQAKVQGLSVALIDDQKVVWAQGFGLADRDAGLPATAETVYRIGTISELFTVTAALQLADEGKLVLDRPLCDYVPEFAMRSRFPNTPPVTLWQLMTEHSGLPAVHLRWRSPSLLGLRSRAPGRARAPSQGTQVKGTLTKGTPLSQERLPAEPLMDAIAGP